MVIEAALAYKTPLIDSSRSLCPAPEEIFSMSTMEPLVELLRAAQKGPAARLPASRVNLSWPVHLGSPTVEQKAKGYQCCRLPLWWTCMRLLGAT